jgi:hypothetical protein
MIKRQEQRIKEARRKQDMKEEIIKSIQNEHVLQANIVSEIRVENKRRTRELDLMDKEREAYQAILLVLFSKIGRIVKRPRWARIAKGGRARSGNAANS